MKKRLILAVLFAAATLASVWFITHRRTPVFSRDIAPVIHRNCMECHRPDGPGPFSLITYEDMVAKAKTIRHVVIVAEGVFDNTASNPLNPNVPPKPVGERQGSMRTSDEMFQFIVSYLFYKPGDENISLETQPFKPR